MNPQQALQFIKEIARLAPVNYATHAQVDEVIRILQVAITPKKEEVKPDEPR